MQNKDSLPINFGNQGFVLEQYSAYLSNPKSLSPDWIAFFQGIEFAGSFQGGESSLLDSYKKWGHLVATVNPMVEVPKSIEELPQDENLKRIYSGNSSYECYNVENKELESAFHQEVQKERKKLEPGEYKMILRELWQAKYLEEFLQKKFLGAKRFSLEGAESFMPMMFELFERAANAGYKMGIIGMAHRGRLNVLCNLLKKPYAKLFQEFNTKVIPPSALGLGDVKYHRGHTSIFQAELGKSMQLVLASNPSHLESIDPVVLGFAKASGEGTLPVMIHGDASVAGQGVVYESLQCSRLKGYSVGGTIHIVINNQVGFTANPEETRSTRYCTDIAKAFGFPVIHVNAEDPVACIHAVRLAFYVRDQFKSDVFIDLNGCRIYGHNEADEPRFTNPLLYKKIEVKGDPYERVKKESGVEEEWMQRMETEFKERLEKELQESEKPFESAAPGMSKSAPFTEKTAIALEILKGYLEKTSVIPSDFHPHPKIEKLLQSRRESKLIDWATGEVLAFASLLDEKIPVRLSGQDSKRGTFSHRHAVLFDQTNEKTYTPLEHVSEAQATFEVYNSPLSEFAVMGFEFGYTLGDPKALVIWEAQFGDFANGAQVIIDQYLAGSETKWGVHSGLTLFLPHGHEGMGPEHTSCRIERFLELSGGGNWQVVFPSTPAQLFHLLRRQALSVEKRPLIIPMPKSMLRLSDSFSAWEDLTGGAFQPVIDEEQVAKSVKRAVICSGKLYYELKKARGERGVALIRLEQVYPFPESELADVLKRYEGLETIVWAQEEPMNQGVWDYVKGSFLSKWKVSYVGRERMPVPDTGYAAFFAEEQERIIKKAMG